MAMAVVEVARPGVPSCGSYLVVVGGERGLVGK